MICPKCKAEMETFSFKEINIERCTGCKGMWFHPAELKELRSDSFMADYVIDEGKARIGRKFDKVRDIQCPECGSDMNVETDSDQPHIHYESCPQGHGTYLDAGEFHDMVHKSFWDKFRLS